jgi:uracil-DNA glycosylase
MDRCSLCPNVHVCVPPSGPEDAEILFIGEAPGKQENARKQVFVGKTGDEVNRHYLPLAGLSRSRVRFTNAIRCLPTSAGGKLDPKRRKDIELLESCTYRFLAQETVGRRLLVPLGAFACRAICPEIDLEHQHGIPFENDYGTIFPMYHPALGIYEPKKMLMIRNDWLRLGRYLKGTLALYEDAYEGIEDYQEVTDADEIHDISECSPIGCDTESKGDGTPYCLTYSQHPGTGRLIRASRPDLLYVFNTKLSHHRGAILFHNWFYDWKITEEMGLVFQHHRIVDTMAEVYRLGNLPQGLKTLIYREVGMTMQDFTDLVSPYSRELVLNYYEIARLHDWPKPEEQLEIDDQTGLWTLYKPQGMNTKLKRFFTDLSKAPDKDVFGMWEKNWVAEQPMIEAQCGTWPGICISHVPFEKVLHYACRDADALIRFWPILRQMQSRVRKFSQDQWRRA